MNIHIAILAACASTLILTAMPGHAGPIPSVDTKLGKPVGETIAIGKPGSAQRGLKISDNESPRPGNRKIQQQNSNRDHIDQDAQFRKANSLARPKTTTGTNGLTKRAAPQSPVNGVGGLGGGR